MSANNYTFPLGVFFRALAPSAHSPCSPVLPVVPVHPVDGPLGVRPLAVVAVAVRVDGGGLGRPAAVAAGDKVLRHSGYNLAATRGGGSSEWAVVKSQHLYSEDRCSIARSILFSAIKGQKTNGTLSCVLYAKQSYRSDIAKCGLKCSKKDMTFPFFLVVKRGTRESAYF